MESLLISNKKKLATSIIGLVLFTIGVVLSVNYYQSTGIILCSILLGFFLMLFIIYALPKKDDTELQKDLYGQRMSELREQSPILNFAFKYNFLIAGASLLINAGLIISSVIDAYIPSMILFSVFIGITLCSSMIIYLQGRKSAT